MPLETSILITFVALALIITVIGYSSSVPILSNNSIADATTTFPTLSATTQQEPLQNPTSAAQRRQVTLVAVVDDQGEPPRLMEWLFRPALDELKNRHPDLNITLDYKIGRASCRER